MWLWSCFSERFRYHVNTSKTRQELMLEASTSIPDGPPKTSRANTSHPSRCAGVTTGCSFQHFHQLFCVLPPVGPLCQHLFTQTWFAYLRLPLRLGPSRTTTSTQTGSGTSVFTDVLSSVFQLSLFLSRFSPPLHRWRRFLNLCFLKNKGTLNLRNAGKPADILSGPAKVLPLILSVEH